MATYLLLRDNKESGPFSLNDLLQVGLKPYDLVWVPGKSAAWRYPSEIDELKPYAPATEEQPFDRFYKKPAEEKEPDKAGSPIAKDDFSYAPVVKEEPIKFVPKKSVFVTLPGNKAVAVERPIQPKPVIKENSTISTPQARATAIDEPAEIKFSQPLDDIKEMYVKTLQERKSKTARKSYWIANLKKAAVVAGLICVGVLTGFIIKSKPGTRDTISNQVVQATPVVTSNLSNLTPDEPLSQQEEPVLDGQATVEKPSTEQFQKNNSNQTPKDVADSKQPATLTIRKETMIKPVEKKEFETKFDNSQEVPATNIDPITGERIRKLRTSNSQAEEKTLEKHNKNSLHDLVSVASNDYKRVAFGGIRNLRLTVTNNSKYDLDNVIVELQYLKPSEEPLRTENIKFRGVEANGSSTIKIPDTNRGIKIIYRIINIESKQNSDAVAGR